MALHEMWEVSALPMGYLPYEEYFPCEAELALLEKQKDFSRVDVPFLHLLEHVWQSYGSFEPFEELAELSVPQPGGCLKSSSLWGCGRGNLPEDEEASPGRHYSKRR